MHGTATARMEYNRFGSNQGLARGGVASPKSHAEHIGMALKSIGVLLADDLFHYSLQVVAAKGTTQLLIIHRRPILDLSPSLRYLRGFGDFELERSPIDPRYDARALVRFEEIEKELPQERSSSFYSKKIHKTG